LNRLGEVNEVQNSIPSSMNHIFAVDIKMDDSLKVKKRTLVIISCEASSNSKEKTKEDGKLLPTSSPFRRRTT